MEKGADFCIDIKYAKGEGDPTRVFRAMTGLIEAFQTIDTHLVGSIHSEIKPVLLLENIEIGSVRTWFRYALKHIDDDALKNIDWKPLIGQYLVKGKHVLLKFLEERPCVKSYVEVEELEKTLLAEAKATDIRRIPFYKPLSKRQLLEDMIIITDAIKPLSDWDEASYVSPSDKATFNLNFAITPASIEEILIRETITNHETLILKVKKPDYLGESKWEFQSGRIIPAKIEDIEWLLKFRSRNPDAHVLPGDSLKVLAQHSTSYGFDNEIVAEHYVITKVLGVQRPPSQMNIF